MKRAAVILFLSFYLLGTFILPLGDFSAIKDLPDMYRHCRDTEDKDLTIWEFFTEHVSGIGTLIEGVEHEDEPDEDGDKPHVPISVHYQQQIQVAQQLLETRIEKPLAVDKTPLPPYTASIYISGYSASVFRPPMI